MSQPIARQLADLTADDRRRFQDAAMSSELAAVVAGMSQAERQRWLAGASDAQLIRLAEALAVKHGETEDVAEIAERLREKQLLALTALRPLLPPVAVLEAVAAELATVASMAGDTANANALNKAALYLAEGVRPVASGTDLLVPSASEGGVVYRVSRDTGCTCKAATHGRSCWHAALCEVLTVAYDWMAEGLVDDAPTQAAAPLPTPPAPAAAGLIDRLTLARAARAA